MAKKDTKLEKNNKKNSKKNSTKNAEIKKSTGAFNLNEEIIIGINSKKRIEENKIKKKNSQSKQNKKKAKNKTNKINKASKNIEKKDKVKKPHKILKVFIISLVFIIIVVAILLSPLFNVNTITVKNNNKVSKDEIISLSGITLGENTFKYININLIDKIKEHSYIKDVEISRSFPSEIIIKVTERELLFAIQTGETIAYIDNQGYIVDRTSENFELPTISGLVTLQKDMVKGERLLGEDLEKLEKIITIYDYAKTNELSEKMKSFKIEDDLITIGLVDNKVAYISNFVNLNIKILSLKVIMERTEGKSGEIFLDGQGQNQSVLFSENV